MDWDQIYVEIQVIFWVILLSMVSISYLFIDPIIALSILMGGFVIIVNFSCLQHTIRKAFSMNKDFRTSLPRREY